jgi:hypothetical protein
MEETKTGKNDLTYDLFDNPMVRNILKNMSPEDVLAYKKMGKEMYGSIDFEKSEVLANLPPPMSEALAYIKEGLKSGILPKDLDDDEVNLLVEIYGNEWYKEFGYTQHDLSEHQLKNVKQSNAIDINMNHENTTNTIQ